MEKQDNPMRRILCKRKSRYDVSVPVNLHQVLERWYRVMLDHRRIFMLDIYHHHHHIVLAARISLTLFRHSSLSFIALGRSSGQQPVSSHSCWMYVRAGRPAFARPCVWGSIRVHLLWVHLCFSSNVLHVWFA